MQGNSPSTREIIQEIQKGNERLREDFVSSYRGFVRDYASFICKRRLDWHNDDELSIALIAFNRAVDNFDAGLGTSFLGYARVLIKNSLVDYFKSQQKSRLDLAAWENGDEHGSDSLESAASLQQYVKEMESRERAFEISRFQELLSEFSLCLEDLANNSPRHRDTRENLKQTALQAARDHRLVARIYQENKLPLKEIQLLTGTKRKTLEKWRRYLLSLIIIRSHEELENMAEYIWGKEGALKDEKN